MIAVDSVSAARPGTTQRNPHGLPCPQLPTVVTESISWIAFAAAGKKPDALAWRVSNELDNTDIVPYGLASCRLHL